MILPLQRSGFVAIAASGPAPGLMARRLGLVGAAGWACLTKLKFGCEATADLGQPLDIGKLIPRLDSALSQTSPPSHRIFPRHL